MQFTRLAYLLLLGAPVLLALSAAWPPAALLALLWLAGWIGALWGDWRLAPAPRDWEVTRSHEQRFSIGAWNPVTVSIRLRRAVRPVQVAMRDTPPPSFAIDGERILQASFASAGALELAYRLRPPRRGDYTFGDLFLRWSSPLRLINRQARFPAHSPIKVYPNLAGVRAYDLVVRRNRIWELGLRSAQVMGSGSDFERLRDYVPDDEYRRINWQATARRGRPISAEYQTERSQNLVALLDVGRLMRSPVGDLDKLDYAINAVLLLSYVAARKGDRVGLLAFAEKPLVWLAPRPGKGQFHRMLELLYRVQAAPVEPDYGAALAYFAVQQQKRTLALLFTDLTGSLGMDALVAQMARLRRSHLPLLVTIGDPGIQRMSKQPVHDDRALYERTAAEQALDERALTVERLRAAGVSTLDVPADELSVAVINRYLELKARTRL